MSGSLDLLYLGNADQNQVCADIAEVEKHLSIDLTPATNAISELRQALSFYTEGFETVADRYMGRVSLLTANYIARNELIKLEEHRVVLMGVDQYGNLLLEHRRALESSCDTIRKLVCHVGLDREDEELCRQKLESFRETLAHADKIVVNMTERYRKYTDVAISLSESIRLAEAALGKSMTSK